MSKSYTVLSLEQALSLPSATLRFAQLGWRVIRIEATPYGEGLPGDPNRYIGGLVADEGRRSYFVAPNVGKQAVALNLKATAGQEALRRMITALDAEIFCCNTIPGRYRALGIDYETLVAARPDLIWAGISAMGPEYPDAPGYDPVIQAMAGYMELTGPQDGPPTLSGIPLVDLKAGDEVYAGVMMALAEKAETGKGGRIDVSMLQAAASWLITTLPLVDMDCGPEEITRWGNAHRKFIPTNVYPTTDGFIYVAIGSNAQWERLCATQPFTALAAGGARDTAEGRYAARAELYREIGAVTSRLSAAACAEILSGARIPHALVNNIPEVHDIAAVRDRISRTVLPDGRQVRLQPMAVDVEGAPENYDFPPRYGEHTEAILAEAGYGGAEIAALRDDGVIGP